MNPYTGSLIIFRIAAKLRGIGNRWMGIGNPKWFSLGLKPEANPGHKAVAANRIVSVGRKNVVAVASS